MALFTRLVDAAVGLYGRLPAFDPYVVEWHRRGKADRPSGTARALAGRIVAAHPGIDRAVDGATDGPSAPRTVEVFGVRAGANPGAHLVGFDGPGESIELRIGARDRTAYAAGALAAADWLLAEPRRAGIHGFDEVVDDLLGGPAGGELAMPVAAVGPGRCRPAGPRRPAKPRHPAGPGGPPGSAGGGDGRPLTASDCALSTSRDHDRHPKEPPMPRSTCRTDPRPARLQGALTALVTPFTEDGAVDEVAFRRLVSWQIISGIDGLVPCGTTGESPTLSPAERERSIAITVEIAREGSWRRRITVVAGTGTNDTRATVRATRRAAELGADAALVVAPYYNRPDQRMLDAHYRAVADDGGLPVIVYNVPSRTGTNVEADTFLRLAEHPRIVAVKEASGNLEQIARICRERPPGVAVLAGDDAWTLAMLAMGADGVISVASNEVPAEMAALCAAARDHDWARARRAHDRLLPLFPANFRGAPNPVPVKAALAMMGLLETDAVRAPLLALEEPARGRLAATIRDLGLVELPGGRGAAGGTPARTGLAGVGNAPIRLDTAEGAAGEARLAARGAA